MLLRMHEDYSRPVKRMKSCSEVEYSGQPSCHLVSLSTETLPAAKFCGSARMDITDTGLCLGPPLPVRIKSTGVHTDGCVDSWHEILPRSQSVQYETVPSTRQNYTPDISTRAHDLHRALTSARDSNNKVSAPSTCSQNMCHDDFKSRASYRNLSRTTISSTGSSGSRSTLSVSSLHSDLSSSIEDHENVFNLLNGKASQPVESLDFTTQTRLSNFNSDSSLPELKVNDDGTCTLDLSGVFRWSENNSSKIFPAEAPVPSNVPCEHEWQETGLDQADSANTVLSTDQEQSVKSNVIESGLAEIGAAGKPEVLPRLSNQTQVHSKLTPFPYTMTSPQQHEKEKQLPVAATNRVTFSACTKAAQDLSSEGFEHDMDGPLETCFSSSLHSDSFYEQEGVSLGEDEQGMSKSQALVIDLPAFHEQQSLLDFTHNNAMDVNKKPRTASLVLDNKFIIDSEQVTASSKKHSLSDKACNTNDIKSVRHLDILTSHEEKKVKEFVDAVDSNNTVVNRSTAVKFLMARKFDVNRAVDLYFKHEQVRSLEDIAIVDPTLTEVKRELQTEKFTVLPSRDTSGAAIALFTARYHIPTSTTHQATLKALVFQLDAALESIETQRNGLVFIYDMTQAKYVNFDYDLSTKILKMLKGGYPARLKKVLIVTAPLWFKAPFKVLRLFVREKLQDRVYTVNLAQLATHISPGALPQRLGGTMVLSHRQWIAKCLQNHWGKNSQIDNDVAAYFESMDNMVPELSIYSLSSSVSSAPSSPEGSNNGGFHSSEHDSEGSKGTVSEKRNHEYREKEVDNHVDLSAVAMDTTETAANVNSVMDLHVSGEALHNLHHHRHHHKARDSVASKHTSSSSSSSSSSAHSHAAHSHLHHASTIAANNGDNSVSTDRHSTSTLSDVKSIPCKRGSDMSPSEAPSDGQTVADHAPKRKTPSPFEDSIHKPEPGGLSIKEFMESTRKKGRTRLIREYEKIKATPPKGTFNNSRSKVNLPKNRYTDVLCYDHSRVVLSACDEDSDYINANFVDGYRHKDAYISTQGPLPRTFGEFWRMVWEQRVLLVVMTTRTVERGRIKCGQYWPCEAEEEDDHGHFTLLNTAVDSRGSYNVTSLVLTNTLTGESRHITHFQFTSWPDYGVPHCAEAFLDFMLHVRTAQAERTQALGDTWHKHPNGPPIVIHCSAGIGRTGTFISMDILTRRLADIGSLDVHKTVERIRSQRAFSIQMPDQYVFIHLALLEHAQREGLIDGIHLAGFSDSSSESD